MTIAFPCIKRHLSVITAQPDHAGSSPQGKQLVFHYGREYGFLLEDVDEMQLLLLSLLDGTHHFTDIMKQLQAYDKTIIADEVADLLHDLASLGIIEDAGVVPPPELTSNDLTRYASQVRFFSLFDRVESNKYAMQMSIKHARIAVLGLGGLGSNVLIGLAAMGVGALLGVDCDVVELGNLNRQVLYGPTDVGRPKVEVAAEQMRRFNPELLFEGKQCWIRSAEHIVELIQGYDLVVMCADDPPESHSWMNQASLQSKIPFLTGGYHGAIGEVGPFVIPYQTGCFGCKMPDEPQAFDLGKLSWINDASRLRHPNAHFVTALIANLLCGEIAKYLTHMAVPATYNTIYQLDIEHFTLAPIVSLPRRQDCRMCGTGAPSSLGDSENQGVS